MGTPEIAKPLLKSGLMFLFEVARCAAAGLVLSALVLWGWMGSLPAQGAGFATTLAVLWSVLVVLLFAVAGQQRGIRRVLSNLTGSHGSLLFDHTLGRFLEAVEARQPGGTASLLATPKKLADGFKGYVAETRAMPGWLKRVSLRYVERVTVALKDESAGALPAGLFNGGRLELPLLRQWTVDRTRNAFEPSWQGFLILCGVHLAVMAALSWWARH